VGVDDEVAVVEVDVGALEAGEFSPACAGPGGGDDEDTGPGADTDPSYDPDPTAARSSARSSAESPMGRGPSDCHQPETSPETINNPRQRSTHPLLAESGLRSGTTIQRPLFGRWRLASLHVGCLSDLADRASGGGVSGRLACGDLGHHRQRHSAPPSCATTGSARPADLKNHPGTLLKTSVRPLATGAPPWPASPGREAFSLPPACSTNSFGQSLRPQAPKVWVLLAGGIFWARRARIPGFVKLAETITRYRTLILNTLNHSWSNARVKPPASTSDSHSMVPMASTTPTPPSLWPTSPATVSAHPPRWHNMITHPTQTSGESCIKCS
jgi:hypothetical protein